MNYLKNLGGGDDLAKNAGQKAGQFVEQKVKEVMGGKGEQQKQPQKPQQPQQPQQPQKPQQPQQPQKPQQQEDKGGDEQCFGLEDALSLVNNKGQEGGNAAGGLKDLAGGLFK